MNLTFIGGTQTAEVRISKDKELSVKTKRTGYVFAPITKLFSEGQADTLQSVVKYMELDGLRRYVVDEFGKMGYKLVREQKDE